MGPSKMLRRKTGLGLGLCGVVLLAWAVTATTAANVLLAEPETPNRGGAATLLISVPGALVPGIEYKPVVDAIRARANLTLWTAVLTDFVGDFPTPPEALQGVLDAIAAARAAGFNDLQDSDVWLIAHSLGGTISGDIVRNTYGGLILMGSYLPGARTEDLRTYPKPALHMAGDLDGLVQLTRAAEEFRVARELLAAGREDEAVRLKPTVVFTGMNHAQMGDGFVTETLRTSDFPAEISQDDATAALAATAARFLELHRRADDAPEIAAAAYAVIRDGLRASEAAAGFFLDAQDADADAAWCELAQRTAAALGEDADARLAVAVELARDPISFEGRAPTLTVSGGGSGGGGGDNSTVTANVAVPSYLEQRGVGTQSEGVVAFELACKLKQQSAVVRALALLPGQYGPAGLCRTATLNLLTVALAAVAPASASRYAAIGKPIVLAPDAVQASEAAWNDAQTRYDEDADALTITSPILVSTGAPDGTAQYCKVPAAARLATWILHNALPRGLP